MPTDPHCLPNFENEILSNNFLSHMIVRQFPTDLDDKYECLVIFFGTFIKKLFLFLEQIRKS